MRLSGSQWQQVTRVLSALGWLGIVSLLHWLFPLPEELVRMVQGGFIALVLQGVSRPLISARLQPADSATAKKTEVSE